MSKILKIKSLDTIEQTARQFVEAIGDNTVFAFFGKMGAGKTTFIKTVCQEIGVIDTVNSPTFSIINEYKTINGLNIYHIDCYRINNINEAINLGFDDYLCSENICFIEWAEKIAEILPDNTIGVTFEEEETGGTRILTIEKL
ncbi:MAG: tRNA (adenosine(37)-N6)-threonylcarbamoyltransferase complex ATPase subunit type 1 TsaE [Paludibacter sp.]|nr:tRNA (adenosine(37)-N6)-threonylcarbamoyltransferase complex ATPase subunit type 1 TsaE [Paludibacter sp.]